jgi:hypothetical protein
MNSRAVEPSIAIGLSNDSAVVLSAWRDLKYGCLTDVGCSILGRFSNNAGNTFEHEERFDVRPAAVAALTAVRGNIMAVGWNDDLLDGGARITVSFDHGNKWCLPFNVHDQGDIGGIAITRNGLHVLYTQVIGGRFRIFYRRGVLLPTSVKEMSTIPPPFATLVQNYPNPFNPSTKIVYGVNSQEFVSLKVFDVLGREVARLVEERKEAGEYTIEWKADGMPSGVYYYRLITESTAHGVRVSTNKMLLIR